MGDEVFNEDYWREMAQQRKLAELALEDNARRERWSRMTDPARTFTVDELDTSRQNYRNFLARRPDVSQTRLARLAGVGTALGEFLKGKYRGDNSALVRKVDAAISDLLRRDDGPGGPQFVETSVAKRIFTIVKTCAQLSGIGAFYCVSGVGKSMALAAMKSGEYPSALLVEVTPDTASPVGLGRELLRQATNGRSGMDIRSRAVAFRQLVDRLKDSKRMILIDEADGLHLETFNFVRQIHDATGCPIVLSGRPNLRAKIDRTTRCAEIGGSFRGRLCVEHDLMSGVSGSPDGRWLFTVQDVARMLGKFKVKFTADTARWLTMLANLSAFDGSSEAGGLRYASKVFQLALLIARTKNLAEVTVDLVKTANGLARDAEYAATIGHRVDESLRTERKAAVGA